MLHPGLKWGHGSLPLASPSLVEAVWWDVEQRGQTSLQESHGGNTVKNCKESKILAYVQASKLACYVFLGAARTQKTLGLEIKHLITDDAAASAYLFHLLLAHCPMGAR